MLNIAIKISSGGKDSKNIIEEGYFRREGSCYLENNSIAENLIILSSHSFIGIDQCWETTARVRFRTKQKAYGHNAFNNGTYSEDPRF